MRPSHLFGSACALFIGACTLFGDVDDLEGARGSEDAGAEAQAGAAGAGGGSGSSGCVADKGCLGCASCDQYCSCAMPYAIAKCLADCSDSGGVGGSSSGGAAGGDAAAGSAGSGGNAKCDPSVYLAKTCDAIGVGTVCDKCLVERCCTEISACFASEECAAFFYCYSTNCPTPGDTQCAFNECSECFGSQVFEAVNALNACSTASCQNECP